MPEEERMNKPPAGSTQDLPESRFRIGTTIRTRLLIAFVLLVLLPATVISVRNIVTGLQNGRQQAITRLDLLTTFQKAKINNWVNDVQINLSDVLNEGDAILFVRPLLERRVAIKAYVYTSLEERFERYIERTQYFDALFLLDIDGRIVASTDETERDEFRDDQLYFQKGLESAHVSPLLLSSDQIVMVVAQPVFDKEEETVLGVLVGYTNMDALDEITSERISTGETGKTYLVNHDHTLLTEPHLQGIQRLEDVRTEGVDTVLETQENGSGSYKDYRDEPVIGVYYWLPEIQAALIAEQDQAEVFGTIYTAMGVNVGVALLSVVLAIVASLFVTQSIVTPLNALVETATQIANGDLMRVTKVRRNDEIGKLGQAFNSMTTQLRDLINSLEQRVADRTREMEQHSAYLRASAEVGHTASSVLDADRLIQQVVTLILERFGLYYVGLFLLDEAGEWATLKAGTGEAGRMMMARGHRIRVGEGMIGWSLAHATARIALDVGEDAVRLTTAELPDTRSEAALPLRSRGRVIGALTVQSDQPAAFDRDTVVVLQTMADQVAVALDNARLFTESQAALEAEQRAYSDLSREAWSELLRIQADMAYRSDESGVTGAEDIWRPEMEQALQEGKVIQGDGADIDAERPLAIPIKVRGNVIGVLDTYKPADEGAWSTEEIALLETLADQLGTSLESARLYQDTQHRATREQLTRELTDKMRGAADVDSLLQTTIRETIAALGASSAFVQLSALSESGSDRRKGKGTDFLKKAAGASDNDKTSQKG